MRFFLLSALVGSVLLATAPASAQLRTEVPSSPAPVAIGSDGAPGGLGVSDYFSAESFRIDHSYEMSYTSGVGGSLGLGVYTTSLRWQPTNNLAARVDVGVAHSPFGSEGVRSALGFREGTPARVYLRNAEVAYRPTANSLLHLRVQQNPFGYGALSPHGNGFYGIYPASYGRGSVNVGVGTGATESLFFREGR